MFAHMSEESNARLSKKAAARSVVSHRWWRAVAVVLLVEVLAAPSFAARDAAQMIAQDKANQHLAQHEAEASKGAKQGQVLKLVLPLDHGPRAVTTPALNQQRLAKAAQAAQASRIAQAGQQ